MKQLRIRYFGMLAEVTACEEELLDFSGSHISELLETLYSKHTGLKNKNFQVAQDQVLVSSEEKLTNNEIVLLPPFAGG